MAGIIRTLNFMEAVEYKKTHLSSDVRRYGKKWQLGIDMTKYFDHQDTNDHISIEDIQANDWIVMKDNLIEVVNK